MTTLEVLKKARAIIENPERWCQGAYAIREAEWTTASTTSPGSAKCMVSMECFTTDKNATRFCAEGAVMNACGACFRTEVPREVWDSLKQHVTETRVCLFNDAPARTHAEVLAVFDKAIAAEEAK